jgi:hypothetical protein
LISKNFKNDILSKRETIFNEFGTNDNDRWKIQWKTGLIKLLIKSILISKALKRLLITRLQIIDSNESNDSDNYETQLNSNNETINLEDR